jgi:hypothetical protein
MAPAAGTPGAVDTPDVKKAPQRRAGPSEVSFEELLKPAAGGEPARRFRLRYWPFHCMLANDRMSRLNPNPLTLSSTDRSA